MAPSVELLVALGVAINIASLAAGVRHLLRLKRPSSQQQGGVSLVLPLTGRSEGLERLVAALDAQTLRPRRLIVAVESEDDPAYARAASAVRQASFPVERVVAGLAETQAQKCRNLTAAVRRIESLDEAVVFMDGDIMPPQWWLSALVTPVLDGHSDVVTGYRWQMAEEGRLGAHLISLIDRSLTLLPRADLAFARVVWGGSLAVSRQALQRLDLETTLRHSISDDLSLADRAAEAGLRVLTRGALLVPSPNDQTLLYAWRFGRRQYFIARVYRPWLWLLALVTISGRLAAWSIALWSLPSLFGVVSTLALLLPAAAKLAVVDRIGVELELGEPFPARLRQFLLGLAQPVVDAFHLSLILGAAATRLVRWGHVVYEVTGPDEVRVAERTGWKPAG
jgi:cellulose synthase/poly-beta-1,6-N-acetylglucosamine synthase-like glycosyltransferase